MAVTTPFIGAMVAIEAIRRAEAEKAAKTPASAPVFVEEPQGKPRSALLTLFFGPGH